MLSKTGTSSEVLKVMIPEWLSEPQKIYKRLVQSKGIGASTVTDQLVLTKIGGEKFILHKKLAEKLEGKKVRTLGKYKGPDSHKSEPNNIKDKNQDTNSEEHSSSGGGVLDLS